MKCAECNFEENCISMLRFKFFLINCPQSMKRNSDRWYEMNFPFKLWNEHCHSDNYNVENLAIVLFFFVDSFFAFLPHFLYFIILFQSESSIQHLCNHLPFRTLDILPHSFCCAGQTTMPNKMKTKIVCKTNQLRILLQSNNFLIVLLRSHCQLGRNQSRLRIAMEMKPFSFNK